MKHATARLSVMGAVLLSAASALCTEPTVTRVFRSVRDTHGDENVRRVQDIDDAAWVWAPGHDVWGVSFDSDAWNVQFGAKPSPGAFFRLRNRFVSNGAPVEFDVSADERFTLYLDGCRIAEGPHRGLVEHWYYQSYRIEGLTPGEHLLEAVVWQLGLHAPLAQLSYRGGFILKAAGTYDARLTTGKGAWEIAPLTNTKMTDRGTSRTFGVGSQCQVSGTGFPNEQPPADAWRKAVVVRGPIKPNSYGGRIKGWMLFPSGRPDQTYDLKTPGRVVNTACDLTHPFTVPANSERDLWWDLDDYYCAYPVLETSGGAGAEVTWGWTESLRGKDGKKGRRDEWKGKSFSQTLTDTFLPDGRTDAVFTAPWWRCGRWCRLHVKTAGDPLTMRRVAIAESRYPLAVDGAFACDDPSFAPIAKISRRAMEMCMHEMLFDCPYYEQQMYPGDTRIQLNVISAITSDPRMTRFAISIYDFDRRDNGMVAMNFPTRGTQESATYSMCWAMMFRDFLMWHDDAQFLRVRMPGMRNTLMGLVLYENADGLLENLPGWSFMDWVKGSQPFAGGVSPGGGPGQGVSALNNLQYLHALQSAAAVDDALGERHLAVHWREKADRLGKAIVAACWDDARGILADTPKKDRFSEHAQCLAILGGILTPAQRESSFAALAKGEGLAPTSSYFAHYLFETYAACGRADLIRSRFAYWRNYVEWGARTAFETQDIEARSDCHAWSACPLYFMQTVFAGVTPASPFFRTVRVAPQPAGLKKIRSKTPCPKGLIETDFQFDGDKATGTIVLPTGLTGEFVWRDASVPLMPGVNRVAVPGNGGDDGAETATKRGPPDAAGAKLSLEYDSPAGTWNEALPIGNGRLGAMVYGAPGMERLQLNEDTLWAGGPNYALEPKMKDEIPKIRERILAGDSDGALEAFRAKRLKTSKNGNSFAYQTIGSLCLKFAGHDFPTRYRRSLSLEDAVVRTEYDVGEVTFTRESFASFADDVIVVRLKASRPGAISFTAFFESPWQRLAKSTDEGVTLTLSGRGSMQYGVNGAVRFCTRLEPTVKGGSVHADNGVLFVEGADEAVLWCSAATSFRDWRDGSSVDERAKADRLLSGAVQIGCDAALRRHTDAYAVQFNRCRLDLGPDPFPGRTVPERLASFKTVRDPYLAALYFAFGRYLLISSSQPGTQPPTLQGIWNEWLEPPWNSSYTVNINLEMNYWPVDVANLPDLIEPLLKVLEECAVSGARTARDMYGARGWVMHHNADIWRTTVPVHGPGGLWPMGGAWLAAQLWDHWMFTRDRAFLARAYPVMRGAAEFFLDTLAVNPATGNLTVVPGVSPENIPAPQRESRNRWTTGASADAQILRDLFAAVLGAAEELNRGQEDAAVLKEIVEKRSRLEPLRIGRWGQLQEWTDDMDDPEDRHRHVSHLYCVYPSAQVTPDTPGLFQAAKKSLDARGDVATGWGMGWRVALWARLLDGERAYRVLEEQLSPTYATLGGTCRGGTYPNLLDAHPPFQIDGNLGCTAGIAELLLQSHRRTEDGEVVLDVLPALPKAWPQGHVKGLRAQGGFTVDIRWEGGNPVEVVVLSGCGLPCKVRYGGRTTELKLRQGESRELRLMGD